MGGSWRRFCMLLALAWGASAPGQDVQVYGPIPTREMFPLFLPPQLHQHLDRPSLQHDLGVHWQVHPRWLLTLRYLNNLTHNENTADMGFGFSLSTRP